MQLRISYLFGWRRWDNLRNADVAVFYYKILLDLWMRDRINTTLIVIEWRPRPIMGDKIIPDSAEPRLRSFYPPFLSFYRIQVLWILVIRSNTMALVNYDECQALFDWWNENNYTTLEHAFPAPIFTNNWNQLYQNAKCPFQSSIMPK